MQNKMKQNVFVPITETEMKAGTLILGVEVYLYLVFFCVYIWKTLLQLLNIKIWSNKL